MDQKQIEIGQYKQTYEKKTRKKHKKHVCKTQSHYTASLVWISLDRSG